MPTPELLQGLGGPTPSTDSNSFWRRGVAFTLGVALAGFVFQGVHAATQPPKDAPPEEPTRDFIVTGKVMDGSDKPLEGVEVVANCGIGTLLPTGRTETDARGNYRLAFGPGVLVGRSLRVGDSGVGFQIATISARKPGYAIRGLGREGNLTMADTAAQAPGWATNFSGVVKPREPYRLDFVMEPAAAVIAKIAPTSKIPSKANLCLTGSKLPPSSSVLGCQEVSRNGEFKFLDVPVGHEWWFEMSWREKDKWKTVKSKTWTPKRAAQHTLTLHVSPTMIEFAD